ncbi:hypothetical protein GCM10010420_01710 [Streptomyces glaucosporus]|uniref:Uncharacterized protein n=1 Tax=Streptomyces glaucosporus TaxID=284044 RepID=A0ABP5UMT3_9ACTN
MPEPRDQHDDSPDPRRTSIRRERRKRPARGRRESPEQYDESGEAGSAGSAGDSGDAESDMDRRRRRAVFLRELNEAKALRERVQPRRARAARMRQAMRMRTFRW